MGKLPLTLLAVAALLGGSLPAASVPAWAGGYYHSRPYGYHHHTHKKFHHFRRHHGQHHHRRHHRHSHLDGGDLLLGLGIVGGAVIIGSALAQPRAATPPPVYYTPPPPPRGTCVQDQVYRYLPDGSIQWGSRTRCY